MKTNRLIQILSYSVALILVLVPFQAILTTWAGANFGHIDLFRIWKELLLVPITLAALWLVYRDPKLKKTIYNSPIVGLIAIYIFLHIGLGVYALEADKVNRNALIYALLINTRFLVFFVVCWIVAAKSRWLKDHWQPIILWPAMVVIVFGLLQHFVLANNFLTHFGYGPKTIPAFQAVDQKPDYIRVQSTLRGANPLGTYLLVVISILTGLLIKKKNKWLGLLAVASVVTLFYTYSRSAWLGTFISVILLLFWLLKSSKAKRITTITIATLLVIFSVGVVIAKGNNVVENTLFHTDETSHSLESSNKVRTEAITRGLKSIGEQPLGHGPGTAGPASYRNNHPSHIAENYYIQIGQEVGVIGLVIFIAINVLVGLKLWRQKTDLLSIILLASLIGLTLVNMLSHAWADDTLAYIYWGLLGVSFGSFVIMNKTRKQHG